MELIALLCVCAMIVIGCFVAFTSENDREPGAEKFLSNGEVVCTECLCAPGWCVYWLR